MKNWHIAILMVMALSAGFAVGVLAAGHIAEMSRCTLQGESA